MNNHDKLEEILKLYRNFMEPFYYGNDEADWDTTIKALIQWRNEWAMELIGEDPSDADITLKPGDITASYDLGRWRGVVEEKRRLRNKIKESK